MSFLRTRILRRFSIFNRAADVVLVVGVGLRLAQRKGWIQGGPDELDNEVQPLAIAELALAAMALLRLLRRKKR